MKKIKGYSELGININGDRNELGSLFSQYPVVSKGEVGTLKIVKFSPYLTPKEGSELESELLKMPKGLIEDYTFTEVV